MNKSPSAKTVRWWDADASDRQVYERATSYKNFLSSRQELSRRMDLYHATLYADTPVSGLGPFAYMNATFEEETARLNLIKAATDSWVAAMTKNSPRPMTLTQEGNWRLKRQGKRLNQWLEAQFAEHHVPDDLGPYIRRIAAVFGTGLVKVYEDVAGDDTKWEKARVGMSAVFPWEITVDDAEAQDPRNIRNLFYEKFYDLDELVALFPEKEAEIRSAPRRSDSGDSGAWSMGSSPNLIKVTEGYHLRSSVTAKDGMRCVFLPNATLAKVPYELDRLPFAVWRRAKAPMGWRGIGLPQELRGMQTFINEVMLAYEDAIVFFARPKWMVPRGANVQKAHLDDQIGSVIEFDGPQAPVMYVPSAVMPGDTRQMLLDVWQKGFEQPGISSLFAGGQVPMGLKSGEAIRRYNDTGQARAVESLKLDEAAHVDLGELAIESGRVIAKHNPKFQSAYEGKRGTVFVEFAKVDMERDKFKLRTYPASGLSSTPTERLEQLDMLANHNPPLIDEHTYRVLLEWPDLDQANALANAPYEILDKIMERIFDADDPLEEVRAARNAPDAEMMPLEWMAAQCQCVFGCAFLDDAPPEILQAIGEYRDLILGAIPKAPPVQQGPAAPMPPPIAQGGPQVIPAGQPPPQMAA